MQKEPLQKKTEDRNMALVFSRNGKDYILKDGIAKPVTLRPTTWKEENSWIRKRRGEAGLSLRKLAKESGLKHVALGELERGVRKVEDHEREAILAVLDKERGDRG